MKMRGLQAELDELERTDPAVAEAARKLYGDDVDSLRPVLERYDRHMAARRTVGKRRSDETEVQ